jgi:hypothetical protein
MSSSHLIQETQKQVEGTLSALERDFDILDHSGVVRPLNICIEQMNSLGTHYDAIGSTGRREDVEMANGYVAKHNEILKRVCQLL